MRRYHRMLAGALIDQFTRNSFRGTARAFAGDEMALQAARALVASGTHRALGGARRQFVYLSFERRAPAHLQPWRRPTQAASDRLSATTLSIAGSFVNQCCHSFVNLKPTGVEKCRHLAHMGIRPVHIRTYRRDSMNKSLITLSALVAALFTTQAVLAQDKPRAEVKKEAAAAVKAGDIEKGPSPGPGAAAKSEKDRAVVKKEAATAAKAGTIEKGPSPGPGAAATSVKDRADVKKDAASAVKAGTIEKGPSPGPAVKK